ncbi:ATP synthase F1 subunit gamma [Floccifex sp.]|uniref:ATP synthase F1 subunit gamma n=1 Tax=Floccifex sp. TaxID=2815810 RepID=UPI002A756CA9|nr:ATP synthase F1 subunit gamma [Floccifex sp.]MDD7281350.1 ATP synthase F1 subunit gamma [Erysipelotrichaceae bacterium]MDY2958002.1 ATP synthase F1 subunit gamma [Floccifex sp.]
MAQNRQAIQARIRSVDSTKKITKAMQLVASSKLNRQKQLMEDNRVYASALQELLTLVLQSIGDNSVYLNENEGKPACVFVITSDMGLCGGYNANVLKMIQQEVKPEDHIIMIGSRGAAWAKSQKLLLEECFVDLNEDEDYLVLSTQMQKALNQFLNKEISSIKILYTYYKNTLSFIPTLETILPVSKREEKVEAKSHAQMIFEPSKEEMMANVIPMILKSTLYSRYLESKTSEQASRRMAMENATDNAQQLRDDLEFAFNQARQAAITQEITEIVGGSDAVS